MPNSNNSGVEAKVCWRFLNFNEARWMRGAPAARVAADGEWLWMTASDIRANIKSHGDDPELQKALAAYKGSK